MYKTSLTVPTGSKRCGTGSKLSRPLFTSSVVKPTAWAIPAANSSSTNARAAREVLGETVGEHVTEYGRASRALALSLDRRGAGAEAVAAHRDVLGVLEARLDADDPELARARFELAPALARHDDSPGARAEAGRLAQMSLETYQSLGEAFAPERAAIEAWRARP